MEPNQPLVLVVEDDQGVRESLAMVLQYEGYEVAQAVTGEDALAFVDSGVPDMVVLDVNLPGADGFDICRRLRDRGFENPVLMLTARHGVQDRVAGLDAGADDYLPKPFALDELLARVRAMLRRTAVGLAGGDDNFTVGDLVVDLPSRSASRNGRHIELTKIEFELLELLVTNAGTVQSRETIVERIWGYDENLSSNSLEVFISALRKKTQRDGEPRLIHTIRGVGYVAREER